MAMPRYAFHPMSAADLPMIRSWLAAPHVTEWWGDSEEQFTLLRDDLAHPAMQQFVVALDGHPFAYLQCYDPTAWPNNGFGAQPNGTRGIDQFIGAAELVGRGHGAAFIRSFVDDLLQAGTPRVLTDPDPENIRAVRAYQKAGFAKDHLVDTPDGRALLMVRNA